MPMSFLPSEMFTENDQPPWLNPTPTNGLKPL
jgi:hypothetical protein